MGRMLGEMGGLGQGIGFWEGGGYRKEGDKCKIPIFTIRGRKYQYYSKYVKHYVIILFVE